MEAIDKKDISIERGDFRVVKPIAETHRVVAEFLGETTSALTTRYLEDGPKVLQGLDLSQMCTDIPAPAKRLFGVLENRRGEAKSLIEWQISTETYEWYREWSSEVGAAVSHGAMYSAFIAGLMADVASYHLVLEIEDQYTEGDYWLDRHMAVYFMGGGHGCLDNDSYGVFGGGCLDRDPSW